MSGPPPKNDGTRRNRGGMDYVLARLPVEGRKGRTPKWPLPGRAARGWADLWRTPQAVMWERMRSELAVANYLRLRVTVDDLLAEGELVSAAYFSQIRQSEDALGLSPKGMQTLRWQIVAEEVDEQPEGKTPAKDDRRARLRIVAEEGA